MSKSKEIVAEFVSACKQHGWNYSVRGTVVEITKRISSKDDFVQADMEYYSLLGLLPQTKPGSIWGTDGGGVGALHAMRTGIFSMKKSGVGALVTKALAKA